MISLLSVIFVFLTWTTNLCKAQIVGGSAIGKVIYGMEEIWEKAIIDYYDLINTARDTDGNYYYYLIKENFAPRLDSSTNTNYTHYQFFEAWDYVSLITWLSTYPVTVFSNETVISTLIGGALDFPTATGYTIFGDFIKSVDRTNATIAGRSIGKVYQGMEEEFESLIIDEYDLINTARNFDGSTFYYLLKDNTSPYYDVNASANYTYYEFFEAWDSIEQLYVWLSDYPVGVFNDSRVMDTLIGGSLIFPSLYGYSLFGPDTYSDSPTNFPTLTPVVSEDESSEDESSEDMMVNTTMNYTDTDSSKDGEEDSVVNHQSNLNFMVFCFVLFFIFS